MESELIKYLESIGAIEFAFEDEHGERIYKFTDQAEELVPDLYQEHLNDFSNTVFSLWEKNLIDMTFDDKGEPLIGLNENSLNYEEYELDQDESDAMAEIIATWKHLEDQ